MRSGYLTALSARTLGLAEMLRPVTPSRFEPDALHGSLEVTHTLDVSPSVAGPGAHSPGPVTHAPREAAAREPRGPTGDRTVMEPAGDRASGSGQQPDEALLLPEGRPALWAYELALQTPAPARLRDDQSDSNITGTRAGQQAASVRPAEERTGTVRERRELSRSSPSSDWEPGAGSPDRLPTAARPGRGAGRNEESAAAAGPGAERNAAAPAVVVRIGRVDVRAVQAPAVPPAPAPRRSPPGPSLEEYLLARDRARR